MVKCNSFYALEWNINLSILDFKSQIVALRNQLSSVYKSIHIGF